jgi:hypothetical protein
MLHFTEVQAIVVRVIDHWKVVQKLVSLRFLIASPDNKELATHINKVLYMQGGLGLDSSLLVSAAHDRASVNIAAMEKIKDYADSVAPIGCFSHTLDNCGGKLKGLKKGMQ